MLTAAQVRENSAASAMQPLDTAMRERVDETCRRHEFFVAKARA
jgi:hypothetical protein